MDDKQIITQLRIKHYLIKKYVKVINELVDECEWITDENGTKCLGPLGGE